MNLLFLLFMSTFAFANVFQLKDTHARLTLEVSPTAVYYRSENLQKKFDVKKCNEELTKDLNGELIRKLSGNVSETGLEFRVDGNPFFINPASEFAKLILAMDARMLLFSIEDQKACN